MLNPIKTIENEEINQFRSLLPVVLGTIGGIGYSIYEGAYPVAAGVAALSIMSLPTVKKHFKELTD